MTIIINMLIIDEHHSFNNWNSFQEGGTDLEKNIPKR
jgi:hypothetical protein